MAYPDHTLSYFSSSISSFGGGFTAVGVGERIRRCGYLYDQPTHAVCQRNEVAEVIGALRLVVDGINDDEPAAANCRCRNGFAQCVERQLLACVLGLKKKVAYTHESISTSERKKMNRAAGSAYNGETSGGLRC